MTTAEATVEVATPELRKAFTAVLPHVQKNVTDQDGILHRLRLIFTPDELWVAAANGSTVALAVVAIDEDSRTGRFAADDGTFKADLTPRQARNILRQFKVTRSPAGEAAGEMDEVLEFKASDGELSVTDSGGLFVGESVTFPTLPLEPTFPDLPALLGRALAGVGAQPMAKPLVPGAGMLALFKAAETAYDKSADIRGTGDQESPGFVVAVGDNFRGLVTSRHGGDDLKRSYETAHLKWLNRFPGGGKTLAAV